MKKIIAAAILTLSSLAFAGDAAKLTHIGFSGDGKSYAFMQSGVQDGSGFAYAEIRFLDTANNKYSASAVSVIQEDEDTISTLSDIEEKALKNAEATLKSLEISPSLKGDVLVSRKISDLEARKLKEVSFSNGPIIGGLSAAQYKVKLSTTKVKPAANTYCLNDGVALKMKLELVNVKSKKTTVLQEDKTLPASRGCVHSYEIEDVVVINPDQMSELASKVVVLIRVFTVGFEGEDVRYMAVSGSLNVE
jgi:predicted secreted protein